MLLLMYVSVSGDVRKGGGGGEEDEVVTFSREKLSMVTDLPGNWVNCTFHVARIFCLV